MGYEKRWQERWENGYASGETSMNLSAQMLRSLDPRTREELLKVAAVISAKPIEVVRREMLSGGLRLIHGGKAQSSSRRKGSRAKGL